MWSGQMLSRGGQRPGGLAVLKADSGQYAEAIRFDEYFAFLALPGTHLVAEVVISAQNPIAVPAMLEDSLLHLCDLVETGGGFAAQPAVARYRGQLPAGGPPNAGPRGG